MKIIKEWKDWIYSKEFENEKEIKENVVIKINGKLINYSCSHKFEKEGKYTLEYLFKNNLTKINHMFSYCELLTNFKSI